MESNRKEKKERKRNTQTDTQTQTIPKKHGTEKNIIETSATYRKQRREKNNCTRCK
jgi:hypothetical protein